MPDISMLPAMYLLFDSSDKLLGVDVMRRKEMVGKILEEHITMLA